MQSNPNNRPTTPTVGYAEAELELAKIKLARVELWARSGQWRESGSDGLFRILEEK
jgi:hypothetical protein